MNHHFMHSTMFKCHVIIYLSLIICLKESNADFWCKDSALWDLLNCLHINECETFTNDPQFRPQFYCILACAEKAGDCVPKISQLGNIEVSLATEFYECMRKCEESPSKFQCWKSCDKFSATYTNLNVPVHNNFLSK